MYFRISESTFLLIMFYYNTKALCIVQKYRSNPHLSVHFPLSTNHCSLCPLLLLNCTNPRCGYLSKMTNVFIIY